MKLVTTIYTETNTFPKEELYGLTSQIRRAAISIPSNIAEGYGRETKKEYARFLNIAIGSLFELQTQLEIGKNINFISEDHFDLLIAHSHELEKMLLSYHSKVKKSI